MKKTLFSAFSLLVLSTAAFASGLSDKHQALGLTDEPAQAQCLACHGDHAALAEKTNTIAPNPHANHMGRVQCNACHYWKGESKLMCNDCHSFPELQKHLNK